MVLSCWERFGDAVVHPHVNAEKCSDDCLEEETKKLKIELAAQKIVPAVLSKAVAAKKDEEEMPHDLVDSSDDEDGGGKSMKAWKRR